LSRLVLDGITKSFGAERVLAGVSLAIEPGEIVALLGPSGSGKTTLLRILAGFETADAGEIRLAAERVDRLRPERRGFGMVFQHYALFPHLTVGGNVAFGLESMRLARAEVAARVAAALARVDLAGFERRRVGELSGGQQQRVALARALAPEPRVLLLDEPLSNLDPGLRERTRRELAARLGEIGITTVLVTHEQEEAFELGRRVALLERGRLAQVGTPAELYRAPATRFVASFVGRGALLPARVAHRGDELLAECAALGGGAVAVEAAAGAEAIASGELFVRPEEIDLVAAGTPESVPGTVGVVRFAGPVSWATVALAGGAEIEALVSGAPPAIGERVGVRLRPGARPRLFAAEDAAR
jgi:ABC-type Fe3+/spermidine/putrescine transport system ATPase subunit